MKYNNIYAVVPIRAGSKRFKDKNIYKVAGLPLFCFAGLTALNSGVFNKVIISSDSDEYLDIALKYGFSVHYRSSRCAQDDSSSEDVMIDVVNECNIEANDWIFLIQATSPFQREEYFQQACSMIGSNKSVLTYVDFKRFFIEDVVGKNRPRSQDVSPRKLETGLFWGVNVGELLKNKNRIVKPYGLVRVSPRDDLDIDYFSDLEYMLPRLEIDANKLMKT